ncbi:hypothetical protein [Pontixanthobacter luteolus]|uniref:hypothetical protein n=1 Tax=Pontixanthobacter luteolus TaxID=295089 RepID=UPI0023035B01|nr:hypothetical protein [Pontixanthobacter luteolus]
MFKPFFFFCAAALGGLFIMGYDLADIKREMLNLSGENARVLTGNDSSGDWGD